MEDRLIKSYYELAKEGARTQISVDDIREGDGIVTYSAKLSAGGYDFIIEYSAQERRDITGLRIRCHIKGVPKSRKKVVIRRFTI